MLLLRWVQRPRRWHELQWTESTTFAQALYLWYTAMYQAAAVVLPGAGQVIRLLVFRSSWVGQPGMWHWYNRVIGGTTTSPCTMDTHTYVVSELSANFGKTAAWQRSPSHPAWEELRSGPSANAGSLSYHRSMCVSLCEGGRPTSLIRDWELDKFEASIKTNTSHTPTLNSNSLVKEKKNGLKHPPQSFQNKYLQSTQTSVCTV